MLANGSPPPFFISGVIEVLDKMLALEVSVDYDTCVHYLCPRLNLSNPLLAIRKLQDRNLKMQQILTPICISLLQNNQIKDVTSLCKYFCLLKSCPLKKCYKAFLHWTWKEPRQ